MSLHWPNKRYNSYPQYIKDTFGKRIQKLSIHAGFTCPNRDGTQGHGGCTYCNNQSFNPEYCHTEPNIRTQIDQGLAFFNKKYPDQQYLAYFQAYTNTYDELSKLKEKYEQALEHPRIIGLVIGTRPDCISVELLQYLSELQKDYYIAIEYGVESTKDESLVRINRGHNYARSVEAILQTKAQGIPCGAHLILGLPGENKKDIIQHAHEINKLPIDFIKLHQLQLIKGTAMASEYLKSPEQFELHSAASYIDLVIAFIEQLSPQIIIERFISQSPKELLIAPHWGLKNFEFVNLLENILKQRDTWQGKYLNT